MAVEQQHAVVLGGSIAGLLAARVLAEHFREVTVVERDALPTAGEHRRGVPQGQHIHGLLASGAQVLERLFPGFGDEVVGEGGVSGELTQRGRVILDGHPLRRYPSDLRTLQGTRPFLEGHVRRRVRDLPNVQFIEECDADGLLASADGGRVTGTRLRQRPDGEERQLYADIVVDATGRGSRTPRWLEELGYPPPEEQRVGCDVRYMTRLYRRRPEDTDSQAVLIAPSPPNTRGGGAMAVEGDRWIVTIFDYFGRRLPRDHEGYLEFASSLAAPDLGELLSGLEPLTEAVPASYPASQRRRFDQVPRFPEGYLVIGDALCSFNPIYGQGMSVAAIEADALSTSLREGGTEGLPGRFFKRAAKATDVPWTVAVGSDLRFDDVEGRRTPVSRVLNWYMAHLFRAAEHDAAVARAFITVNNLQAPPTRLVHPATIARVARGNLRRRA